MNYNPLKHHRSSTRLRGYDYTKAGVYFVTLCTFERECLFGEVVGGEMLLNDVGELVREEWLKTEVIRKEIRLDEFQIMPNHLHAIIVIRHNANNRVQSVGTHGRASLQRQPRSIGSLLAGFKPAREIGKRPEVHS